MLAHALLFQSGFTGDVDLILKIVGLLFIMSFVRQHVQHPLLSLLIIVGMAAFLLFDFWKIFGSALFLYLLVTFGAAGLLVDLGFLGGFDKMPEGEQAEGGDQHHSPHKHHQMRHVAHNIFMGLRRGR